MRTATFTVTALVLLALSMGVGTAAEDLAVGITEEASTVTIEVHQSGVPVSGANVSVASVGPASALDGEYVTDDDGEVVFDSEKTENLSGVHHFRVTVETASVSKSRLATITRSPDVERSAPLGQRISMSLQDSAARTRGAVAGTIFVTGIEDVANDEDKIDVLRSHAELTIDDLEELRLERQALGRRHATGDLNLTAFFTEVIQNSGQRAMHRQDLQTTLDRLDRYSVERLEQSGVDVASMRRVERRLRADRSIPSGTSISLGR